MKDIERRKNVFYFICCRSYMYIKIDNRGSYTMLDNQNPVFKTEI